MSGSLPSISIVTPSYNQGLFLEEAITSVVNQGYPNLEYVIMDGGSKDGSVDIIRKHEAHLSYWQSQPDGGQYAAINQGFAHTSGEIMAWLNSDDKYMPWAFSVVADIFDNLPEVQWLTSLYAVDWNERGQVSRIDRVSGYSRRAFWRGAHASGQGWFCGSGIKQETTFWRRSLWERAGGFLDASTIYAGDFELWARFFKHEELYAVQTPLAGIRKQPEQKTALHMNEYRQEARAAFIRHQGKPYSVLESLLRRGFLRARPLLRPRSLAAKLGVLYESKVIVFPSRGANWQIQNRHIV